MRIAVTGGCGRAGKAIISELLKHGCDVVNIDIAHGRDSDVPVCMADVRNYGEALSALEGAEAVVHMARSHPHATEEVIFTTNITTTYNVLKAADVWCIKKIVLASSINAIGAAFCREIVPPLYFPIDEEHPTRAEDGYSLSKWAGEQIADGFARRRELQIASFRLHGLVTDEYLKRLQNQPQIDPRQDARGFWGYLHVDDCARACRLAIENGWKGHETFFINASDTQLSVPTEEALDACYPGVRRKTPVDGFQSPISISKAEKFFGWKPLVSWRGGQKSG